MLRGGDDLADLGLKGGFFRGEAEGCAEHFVGLAEEGLVFAEESDKGLAGGGVFAYLDVHLDAGVGADGVSGFGAPCAETLDGPAYFGAVHGGEVAGGFGFEGASGAGFVEGSWVFKDAGVAVMGVHDF